MFMVVAFSIWRFSVVVADTTRSLERCLGVFEIFNVWYRLNEGSKCGLSGRLLGMLGVLVLIGGIHG